jgi:nicotinamide-nucleotide amidase
VTYSNEAKAEALGVDPALIARHGAVSAEVACAMAAGVLAHSRAELSVSVTGIAGPGGGSAEKPVGLVWFGVAHRGGVPRPVRMVFPGDRASIRAAAVSFALSLCTTPIS